jgi:hypothetical protein
MDSYFDYDYTWAYLKDLRGTQVTGSIIYTLVTHHLELQVMKLVIISWCYRYVTVLHILIVDS